MKHILLAGLASLGLVSSAQAGMVSYIDDRSGTASLSFNNEGSQSMGINLIFTLPKFDMAGATLLSAEIHFEVRLARSLIRTTNVGQTNATFDASYGGTSVQPGFPGVGATGTGPTALFSGTLMPGEQFTDPYTWFSSYDQSVDAASLSSYIGAGSIVSSGMSFNRSVTISNLSAGSSISTSGNMSAAANVTITYVYEEVPAVPEPSTFALLGIGGVALAGYGWRRKRQPAA